MREGEEETVENGLCHGAAVAAAAADDHDDESDQI